MCVLCSVNDRTVFAFACAPPCKLKIIVCRDVRKMFGGERFGNWKGNYINGLLSNSIGEDYAIGIIFIHQFCPFVVLGF